VFGRVPIIVAHASEVAAPRNSARRPTISSLRAAECRAG
jgi:hypothetical protein